MFSPQTIKQISDVAAWRAAEQGRKPLYVWSEDDAHHLPFLGEYVPAGYRPAVYSELPVRPRVGNGRDDEVVGFMVDSSGMGDEHEPALTFSEFTRLAKASRLAWAVVQAGQFQVVVGAYAQDADAPGTPGPDTELVKCPVCHVVHNDLEDHADA